ncbi:MAG: thiamine ABC transporter substrate-binding protein [Nocardioides sp.]|uniref:thiamine ABC transporter substrate-binding protein n=1 Tax=Nocardioides sp. TaxID=35761 RepID=UPI0039E2627F
MRLRAQLATATVLAAALALTGCGGGEDASSSGNSSGSAGGSGGSSSSAGGDVVLLTHDSFSLPKRLITRFESTTGYHLVVRASGDGGELTNKLVLADGSPDGDAVFGIDNTFASRAIAGDVLQDYTPSELPAGVSDFDLPGDDGASLTPIDDGDVCVNVDTSWFKAHGLAAPTGFADLTKPAYQDLTVIPGATTSSPGLAFLLATVAKYGDDWQSYWKDLMDNGAEITDGWSEAYEVDFTAGGGDGDRPIVVSYDSSPAYTVTDGSSSTKALLDTCFQQVEYAGVLRGATNPDGAKALVDFLLTDEVQEALPDSMYVFPVVDGVTLPRQWAKFAVQPTKTWQVDPSEIESNREEWLQEWRDIITA